MPNSQLSRSCRSLAPIAHRLASSHTRTVPRQSLPRPIRADLRPATPLSTRTIFIAFLPSSVPTVMSTFSSATLFFGVCINVMTLAFAGRAWTRVEPVFLAIDLIRARRRRGNLRVIDAPAGHTTVADLPDEVWALIKAEVTAPSYDAEVESFVAEWHETDQSLFPDEDDPEYVEPKTIEHFRACASCFHAIQERGGVDEFLEENIEVRIYHSSRSRRASEALMRCRPHKTLSKPSRSPSRSSTC